MSALPLSTGADITAFPPDSEPHGDGDGAVWYPLQSLAQGLPQSVCTRAHTRSVFVGEGGMEAFLDINE